MQLEMSGPRSSPIETLSHLSTMLQKRLQTDTRGVQNTHSHLHISWGCKATWRGEAERETNESVPSNPDAEDYG